MRNPRVVAPLVLLTASLGISSPANAQEVALRDQIAAQERAGMDALKTGDLAAFAASIAEEAVFVDDHGPATKAEVVQHTAGFRLREYTMTDVRFVPLSADSGLIAYTSAESGTSHGKEFSAKVHVSSVWAKRGGKWLCLFSQETAAK
jgi:ketosteroid isomerase-like protein